MKVFILICILQGGYAGARVTFQEFDSQMSCERAQAFVLTTVTGGGDVKCVPK